MTCQKDIISTEFPRIASMDDAHVTDPHHGGKEVCHKCNGFMTYTEAVPYWDHQHRNEHAKYWFHKSCFNRYEHYYGIDKPID